MEDDYSSYDNGEINIKETYSFYFRMNDEGISRDMKPSEFADQVKLISSFNKLETFWAIYQHLRKPDNCKFGTEIYLFVRDIKPLWEDPQNANGGKISVRLRKKYTTIIWEELILGFIGEIFPPQVQSEITGLVVSIRRDCNLLQVWFKDYSYDKGVLIEDAIKQYLQIPDNVDVETKPFFKNYFGVPNNLSTDEKIKEKLSFKKSANVNTSNENNNTITKENHNEVKIIKTSVDLLFELDDKQISSNQESNKVEVLKSSVNINTNSNINSNNERNNKSIEDIEVVKIHIKEGDKNKDIQNTIKTDNYYNQTSNSSIKYEYGYDNKNYYNNNNNYYKSQNQYENDVNSKKDEYNDNYKKNNYDYNNSYYFKSSYYQNYQNSGNNQTHNHNQSYGYNNQGQNQNSNYANHNTYRNDYNNSYNDYSFKKNVKRGK